MALPVLVYDDDCSFCTRAARFVSRHGAVAIVGFSALDPAMERRLPNDYEACAHFVTDDAIYSCGEAIERALATTGFVPGQALAILRSIPGYAMARERGYETIAANRGTIGRLLP